MTKNVLGFVPIFSSNNPVLWELPYQQLLVYPGLLHIDLEAGSTNDIHSLIPGYYQYHECWSPAEQHGLCGWSDATTQDNTMMYQTELFCEQEKRNLISPSCFMFCHCTLGGHLTDREISQDGVTSKTQRRSSHHGSVANESDQEP